MGGAGAAYAILILNVVKIVNFDNNLPKKYSTNDFPPVINKNDVPPLKKLKITSLVMQL